MTDKIPCHSCEALILPATAERTGGLCMPCFQEAQANSEPEEEAEDPQSRIYEPFKGFAQFDLFTDFKHYDHGLEILKEIIDSKKPGWEEAFPYMLLCMNNLNRHEEISQIVKENPEKDYSKALTIVIESLWSTKHSEEAGKFQVQYFESQVEIPEKFYSATPRHTPWKGPIRLLLADSMAQGLTPAATMEYLLPLVTGARSIVAGFGDEFLLDSDEEPIIKHVATWLWQEFRIYCYPFNFVMTRPDSIVQFFKMFLFRDPAIFNALKKMETEYRRGILAGKFEEAERNLFAAEGAILGFPPCCTKRFSEQRFSSATTPYEKLVSLEVLKWHLKNKKKFPQALTAFEFYPCRPDCSKAVSQTRELRGRYRTFDETALQLFDKVMLEAHFHQIIQWDEFARKNTLEVLNEKICNALEMDWFGKDSLRRTLELRANQ